MPSFFAMTSTGLVDILAQELHTLGLTATRKVGGGVHFKSNWAGCYRANLWLKSATRIVLPVLKFPATDGETLYRGIRQYDFTRHIGPDQTLAVDASIRDCDFRDQRYVAMKIKDAVVDQFREKYDRRPDVQIHAPHLLLIAQVIKNQVTVSIDTSGEALFKRGYREQSVSAPLKEHVAAALLMMTGWNGRMPVLDPMCGSGTFLIEAALMALNIAPGGLRKQFGFQRIHPFDPLAWDTVVREGLTREKENLRFRFYGSDRDKHALAATRANAEMAGVARLISLERTGIRNLKPPCERGLIIVNPPYGERLSDKKTLETVYRDMGATLKQEFSGWTCWILSGDRDLIRFLGVKSQKKYKLYNGKIECRFLRYDIR